MKTVKLLQTHTDAGVEYAPGQVLMLDDLAADFLVSAGVAELVTATHNDAAASEQEG